MLPLIVLIVLFAIGAFVALIRGLLAFSSDGNLLKGGGDAYLERGEQQNRLMTQRVFFQALAVFVIALLGAMSGLERS